MRRILDSVKRQSYFQECDHLEITLLKLWCGQFSRIFTTSEFDILP